MTISGYGVHWQRWSSNKRHHRRTEMTLLCSLCLLAAALLGAHANRNNRTNVTDPPTSTTSSTNSSRSRRLKLPHNIFEYLDADEKMTVEVFEADAAPLDTDFRIVGGTAAPAGKYPFYVNTLRPILCGGTLIHADVVLSAAHCKGGFLAGVSLGGLKLDGTDGTFLGVDEELLHPDYNETTRFNDIMLVKLSETTDVAPIALNFNAIVPRLDDRVTVIGYGDTSDDGEVSTILLEVTVDAFSDSFCDGLYRDYEPSLMVCAGTEAGGKDSCQGDSGGPLFTADISFQVGVVSTGSGCGAANIPAIYTEVAGYEAWIRKGICDLSSVPPTSCNTKSPTVMAPASTPVVAPTAPVVAPIAPVVAPIAPVVAPIAPVVAPIAPVVAPSAPVVAPVVTPVTKPTTKAPTTKAPTTKAPTTKAPTTKAPTTKAPTTKAPTTAAPVPRPTPNPTRTPPTTITPSTSHTPSIIAGDPSVDDDPVDNIIDDDDDDDSASEKKNDGEDSSSKKGGEKTKSMSKKEKAKRMKEGEAKMKRKGKKRNNASSIFTVNNVVIARRHPWKAPSVGI